MKKRTMIAVLAMLFALILAVGVGCSLHGTIEKYTVRFMNGTETFLEEDYALGESVRFPAQDPTKAADATFSYTFLGWNYSGMEEDTLITEHVVHGPQTFFAVYKRTPRDTGEPTKYRVTFRDSITNEPIGEPQDVEEGASAVLPDPPLHNGFHFVRWSVSHEHIYARTEIEAIYERNQYTLKQHYLGEDHEKRVEYEARFGGEPAGVDSIFKFEGWFWDTEYRIPVDPEDTMPADNCEIYGKYDLDFSRVELVPSGELVYGGGDDYVRVAGLSQIDGLVYTYHWQDGTIDPELELMHAGTFRIEVEVTGNYRNGLLTADTKVVETFTVQKAALEVKVTIPAASRTIVYGDGEPEKNISYEGFQYNDSDALVSLSYDYHAVTRARASAPVYSTRAGEVHLDAGSYMMETKVETLRDYEVEEIPEVEFTVTRRPLKVSLAIESFTYGDPFAPQLSFDSFVYGDTMETALGMPTYTFGGSAYAGGLVDAGSYEATVSGFAVKNYEIEYPAAATPFTVAKKDLSLTVTAQGSTYGVRPTYEHAFVGVVEGDLANFGIKDYTLTKGGQPYDPMGAEGEKPFGAGQYTVTVKKEDVTDTRAFKNYNLTTIGTADFTVEKAQLRIGLSVDARYTYGDTVTPQPVFATFCYNDSAASLRGSGKLTYTRNGEQDNYGYRRAGSYTVDISGYTSENYEISYETASFVVDPAPLKLTVQLQKTALKYGETPAVKVGEDLTGGILYEGFKHSDTVSSVFGSKAPVVQYRSAAQGTVEKFHVGSYTAFCTPEEGLASNYTITIVTQDFSVSPRTLFVGIEFETETSLVYGNKPQARIIYAKEGYDGFLEGEEALAQAAYIKYTGAASYTQAQLDGAAKMVVGSYTLSVEGMPELSDYTLTYQKDGLGFEITKKALQVTLTEGNKSYTYGDKPVVDIQFEGFAYDESAAALFGEKASTLSYFKDSASAHYAPKTYFEAGSYTATLEGLENENYTISVQGAAFTVEKKLLTVTAAEAGYTYGDPRPEPTLSYSGFVPNEDRSVLTGTPSYTYKHETTDCTAQEYFDVGSYTVAVKGYTSSNYTIEYVDGTFTVAKRDAVVTVSAQGATYGTAPTLSYAAPRILARDMAGFAFAYAYTFSRTANGQKNDYTPLSFAYYQAGNYTVTLKYTANENYTLTVQSADFAIAKKPLTVGLKGVEATYVYGTVPAPALTFSGFVGEENEEVFTAKPSTQFTYYNSDSRSTSVRNFPVGNYFVGATSGYAADNYAVTYAEKTAFAVTKAPLTVTVNVADITYGATPAPTVTYSKFAFSDSATSLTGRVQYTYTLGGEEKQGTLHAGNYTVSASGLSSPNYEITYVSHGLTVAKKALKVSVSVADFTYGAQPAPVLGYEGFIRGESENNLTGSLVYTYSGEKNAKNFLRAGQHTLTLSGYASGDYAITYGTASFNVAKKAITVEVTEQNNFASFTYDGSRKLVLTSTAQGLVEGDTQEGIGTLTYVLSGTRYASADVSGVLHADRYTFTAQGYTSNDYVISYVYGSGKSSAVSFTVSPAEVKLTLKEGWAVYGDDTAGEWYTVEGSIYNGELTFGKAIEKDNAPYDGKDTYFPHGTYKVTVSYKVNPDYRVTAKGAELSGSTSVSFTVAKKNIEIASGGTQPWAKRGDWSYAPKLEDSRFTLTGTIVLKNAESLEAQEYRANSVGEVFDWKDAYKITLADGTDVTENFTVTYSFNLMLSNSSFSIEKPEAVFTYDSKAHTFRITATAEGIEAQEIKIQYKTEEAGEYGDALPQFTNAGSYTVWYKVTAPNCDPDEGSFAVTGNKATPNLAAFADTNTYTYNKGTFLDAQAVRSALVKGNVYEDATVEFSLTGSEFHAAFPEVKNAGSYTITLKVSGDNYIEKTAAYTLTVQKATVEAPEIKHKTYNKELQLAEVAEDALYTVQTNEGGTAAGEYDVVLALSDASNYRWASDAEGTQETLKLTFTIDKATLNMGDVKWDYEPDSFTYDLQPHAVALTGLPEDGNIEVTYQSEEGTQAGEYHAVATLTYDSANYNDIQTEWKLTWNIAKADYDLQGVTDETGYIYTGAAQGRTLEELTGLIKALGEDGFKVNFSGEHQFTNANEEGYTVKYTVTGNENYNDVTDGAYQVKIGKAQAAIDTSAIVFGELVGEENAYRATYKGEAYTVDWAAAKPQDDFHGTLTAEMIRADGESSFTNFKEGGYTVTLTIDGTSNYEGATRTFTITIEKAEYVVTEPSENTFTYNGKLQGGEVEVEVFGSDGFTLNYGEGGHQFKNANEAGYTVTYTVSGNENYNDKSGSYSVKIMKAEYVVTEPSENTFTYNGMSQGKAVTAAGVIENDTLGEIAYEGGNQRTDANEDGYTITYTVAGNENYNEHSGSYTLTIMKAEASLDLSGITTEFTYTGEAQSVALERAKAASAVEGATGYGVITFEKDGASIEEFKFTDVDEGNDVTITVKLSEGTNFHAAEQQLTLTVKKAQAVIDTSAIEFGELVGEGNNYSATYKAAAYTVDWAAAKSNFGTVENDATEIKNAETYTVTLSVEGTSNYESATLTYTITIEKAKASIDTDEVEKQYTYSGAEQTVEGAKAVGIEGDTEGLGEIGYSNNTFTNVPVGGKQTVKITLSEGTNYLGATAEVEITIEKATLTVTSAGYDGSYDGQEHTGSVTVAGLQGSDTAEQVYSIRYNGAPTVPMFKDVVSGESGKVGYTIALLSENYKFNAEADANGNFTVSITPAEITLTWTEGTTYDPDKVYTVSELYQAEGTLGEEVLSCTVTSYNGALFSGEVKNAGKYHLQIQLNSTNFIFKDAESELLENDFEIARKQLAKPTEDKTEFIYNKTERTYTLGGFEEATMTLEGAALTQTDAGDYVFTVKLADKVNYEWADSTQNDLTYTFTIGKASVAKPDENKTLFVYNGSVQTYELSYDAQLIKVENNTRKNAGEQDVTISLVYPSNYKWKDTDDDSNSFTYTFSVARATIDMKDVVWDYKDPFTYTGSPFSVALTNLPDGVTASYKDASFVNAGDYTAKATFDYDTQNYNAIEPMQLSWKINKAKAEKGDVTIEEQVPIRPNFTLENVSSFLEEGCRWIDGSTPLTAGKMEVQAIYNPDSLNYEDSDPFTVTFTTRKMKITVYFEGEGSLYEVDYGTPLDASAWVAPEGANYICLDEFGEKLLEEELVALNFTVGALSSSAEDFTVGGTYFIDFALELTENEYFELSEPAEVHAILKYKSVDVGGMLYTIEDALKEAQSGATVIVKYNTSFATQDVARLTYSGAEYYTVKEGVTLLLPYADGITKDHDTTTQKVSAFGDASLKKVELSVSDNITLYNKGTITIGGLITGQQGGQSGCTAGDYAQITMGANAIIDSNGNITAYGFIAEKETNNGSQVIMNSGTLLIPFIVAEHRGGTQFGDMAGGTNHANDPDLKTSPFNRFYMENVHPKLTILSGAEVKGHADLFASSSDHETDIDLVGTSNHLINLSTSAKLIAKYNVADKIMNLEIKGTATISPLSMSIDVGISLNLSTKKVHFPVSQHMNVILSPFEDGSPATFDATAQKIKILPGATLKINVGATLKASELVVYDKTSINDISDPASAYPKKGVDGNLIVNGTLETTKLAGCIQTEVDGAKLKVQESVIVTQELSKNTSYSQTDIMLKAKGHGSTYKLITSILTGQLYCGSTKSATGELGTGEMISKDKAWITDNSTFGIEYYFFTCDSLDGEKQTLANAEVNINNPTVYTHKGFTLADPSCSGYEFIGWFMNVDCTQSIKVIDGTGYNNEAITLYGLFQKLPDGVVSYTLTLNGNGGEINEQDTSVVSIKNTDLDSYVLPQLTREGYDFLGWTKTQSASDTTYIKKLEADDFADGNATDLYAQWQIHTFTLKFTKVNGCKATISIEINGGIQKYEATATVNNVPYGSKVKVESGSAIDGYSLFTITSDPEGLVIGVGSEFLMTQDVSITTSVQKDSTSCVVEGTLILMADGTTKKVEDLKIGDLVIVFNHETGKYEAAPVLYNVHSGDEAENVMVIRMKFSDGTTIAITYKHFFYDLDLNCYVLIDEENAHEFIGHRFAKVSGTNGKYETVGVTLTNVTITEEVIKYYSPVSVYHTNLITEGLLSHTTWPIIDNPEGFMNYFKFDENMKYDEEAMRADIDKYGLYTYDDFKDVLSEEAFNAGPWKYFKVAVGKGQLTWDEICRAIDWLYNSGELDAL